MAPLSLVILDSGPRGSAKNKTASTKSVSLLDGGSDVQHVPDTMPASRAHCGVVYNTRGKTVSFLFSSCSSSAFQDCPQTLGLMVLMNLVVCGRSSLVGALEVFYKRGSLQAQCWWQAVKAGVELALGAGVGALTVMPEITPNSN